MAVVDPPKPNAPQPHPPSTHSPDRPPSPGDLHLTITPCFNNNMLCLAQAGLADNVPCGLLLGSCISCAVLHRLFPLVWTTSRRERRRCAPDLGQRRDGHARTGFLLRWVEEKEESEEEEERDEEVMAGRAFLTRAAPRWSTSNTPTSQKQKTKKQRERKWPRNGNGRGRARDRGASLSRWLSRGTSGAGSRGSRGSRDSGIGQVLRSGKWFWQRRLRLAGFWAPDDLYLLHIREIVTSIKRALPWLN
jgi:hypothetical protein